jgi:hypothetical protein
MAGTDMRKSRKPGCANSSHILAVAVCTRVPLELDENEKSGSECPTLIQGMYDKHVGIFTSCDGVLAKIKKGFTNLRTRREESANRELH